MNATTNISQLDEAKAIIQNLLDQLNWVSADSYEREAIADDIKHAELFLQSFLPSISTDVVIPEHHSIFKSRTNPSLVCHAWNKSDAAKVFECTRREVMLVKEHKTALGDRIWAQLIPSSHPSYDSLILLPEVKS